MTVCIFLFRVYISISIIYFSLFLCMSLGLCLFVSRSRSLFQRPFRFLYVCILVSGCQYVWLCIWLLHVCVNDYRLFYMYLCFGPSRHLAFQRTAFVYRCFYLSFAVPLSTFTSICAFLYVFRARRGLCRSLYLCILVSNFECLNNGLPRLSFVRPRRALPSSFSQGREQCPHHHHLAQQPVDLCQQRPWITPGIIAATCAAAAAAAEPGAGATRFPVYCVGSKDA